MSRSASGQIFTITFNARTGQLTPPSPFTPQGPNAVLKFVLTGNGSWVSPFITFTDPSAVGKFGTPTQDPNNQNVVTVTDTNADTGSYAYTISYNPPAGAVRPLATFDPEIENSDTN